MGAPHTPLCCCCCRRSRSCHSCRVSGRRRSSPAGSSLLQARAGGGASQPKRDRARQGSGIGVWGYLLLGVLSPSPATGLESGGLCSCREHSGGAKRCPSHPAVAPQALGLTSAVLGAGSSSSPGPRLSMKSACSGSPSAAGGRAAQPATGQQGRPSSPRPDPCTHRRHPPSAPWVPGAPEPAPRSGRTARKSRQLTVKVKRRASCQQPLSPGGSSSSNKEPAPP